MRGKIVALIGGALLSLASQASAQQINQVVVFGDSNVDSGYYKSLASPGGGATYNSLWPAAVAHGAGSPTTNPGPMSADVLAAHYGLAVKPANQSGGTNYATSGAKNVTVNTTQTGGFTAAISTVTQISNYLAANGGVANSQAIFLVYSGDNDISYANGTTGAGPWPSDPNAYVTQAAIDLATSISALHAAGAINIIVSNLPYSFGSDLTARALRLTYSQTLWSRLDTAGIPFIHADHNAHRLTILANLAYFGFTKMSTAAGNMACTQPSGVTSAWGLLCSSDPLAPSQYITPTAYLTHYCSDSNCHANTAAQKLMGNFWYAITARASTFDFNGDGKSDILWRDTSGNAVVSTMNGAAIASSTFIANLPTTWTVAGTGDFNGDGKRDILWRDTAGNTVISLMNGAQIVSSTFVANLPTSWTVAGIGDFDGDGFRDILWRNTNGDMVVSTTDGTQITASTFIANLPAPWTVAGVGDFDGDGKTDILWRNTSTGDVVVSLMNGAAIASSTYIATLPTSWSVVGVGDFDGDGKSDILWRDTSGNTVVSLMSGARIVASTFVANLPLTWSVAEIGDFNGDGRSDILWRNSAGDAVVSLMNGSVIMSSTFIASLPTSWAVQGANAN